MDLLSFRVEVDIMTGRNVILTTATVSADDLFAATWGIPFRKDYHCDGRGTVSIMDAPYTMVISIMTTDELAAIPAAIVEVWRKLINYDSVINVTRQETIGDVNAMVMHYVGANLAKKRKDKSIIYGFESTRSGPCKPVDWNAIYQERRGR